ncbi:hypothetical protein PC119_g27359, partial [Phytophthora cactorum]
LLRRLDPLFVSEVLLRP